MINRTRIWTSKNRRWDLVIGQWPNGLRCGEIVDHTSLTVYRVTRYDDGRTAYDYPGAIPAYVKRAIESRSFS
jgi:hypothetical protein